MTPQAYTQRAREPLRGPEIFSKKIFTKGGKKGELTTQQIIMLVVTIVSFTVILFFLFRLNLGETTDDELCHNSVVTRGSAIVPSDAIPLNCHRKYICITESGGECLGLTNPERVEVGSLNEVYETLADEMANCWWMFGEGRVNYVGDGLTKDNYCSICSQIYFDESLESIIGEKISKDDLYDYLNKSKIDDSNNYLQYLFGTSDFDSLKKEASEKEDVSTFGNIEIGKQYFVVMGISNEIGLAWKIAGVAGAVGSVIVGVSPIGWVAGTILFASSVVVSVGGEVVAEKIEPEILALAINGRGIENKFMAPTIIEANSEKFEALNCEEILTLA